MKWSDGSCAGLVVAAIGCVRMKSLTAVVAGLVVLKWCCCDGKEAALVVEVVAEVGWWLLFGGCQRASANIVGEWLLHWAGVVCCAWLVVAQVVCWRRLWWDGSCAGLVGICCG